MKIIVNERKNAPKSTQMEQFESFGIGALFVPSKWDCAVVCMKISDTTFKVLGHVDREHVRMDSDRYGGYGLEEVYIENITVRKV